MHCSTSRTLYFSFPTSLALEWEPRRCATIEQSHHHLQKELLSLKGTGLCLMVRKPLLLPWQGMGLQLSPKIHSTLLCQERVDRKNLNSPNRKYTFYALTVTRLQHCARKEERKEAWTVRWGRGRGAGSTPSHFTGERSNKADLL